MSSGLDIHDLFVGYGGKDVVKGLSVSVAAGETVAVIGRSGCGKSTLLRSIAGLVRPRTGRIRFGETTIWDASAARETAPPTGQVALAGQGLALLPHLTAEKNVALALRETHTVPPAKALRQAQTLLESLGLADVAAKYPEDLSGGEYQRVLVARGAAVQPDLLLLDEVTSNLDPQTTKAVAESLWALRNDLRSGQTIMLVTHFLSFAAAYCDRCLFLHHGTVWEELDCASGSLHGERKETKEFLSDSISGLRRVE